MRKKSLNSRGFGLIGVLIAVIVLAAVGGVGVYVYHRDHKAKATTESSNTSSKSSSTTTPPPADPYAGWKMYTDSTNHYGFKYPSDWTLTVDTSQGVSASVRNPAGTVLVSYSNPFVKDSSTSSFYTVDIESVSSNPNLKVIGGAFTANNLPNYSVVNSSLLSTEPLTIGQTSSFETAGRFTDKNSADDGLLTTYPVGKIFTSTDQAKAWFSTGDAKTSLLILQSLAYQQ
jgi:hypothetical protein